MDTNNDTKEPRIYKTTASSYCHSSYCLQTWILFHTIAYYWPTFDIDSSQFLIILTTTSSAMLHICTLMVFQPMDCCMISNRRSYSSLQQHDPFLVSFGKSVTDCLCHSIIERLLMQQHTWMTSLQYIPLVVSTWHIDKEKQQLIDDSFLVWLMHSQWYCILRGRCASDGWTRHNHNWIKKEYIQKQWLSCIGTQGLSRLKRSCWDDWWTKQTTLDQKSWIMDDARHAVIMVFLQYVIPTLSVVDNSESISSEARTLGVPSTSNVVWNTFLSMRLPFVSNNERHVWSVTCFKA